MAGWPGWFSDGETAERHAVRVQCVARRLAVTTPYGRRLAEWPLEDVALCEEVYSDGPVRLRSRSRPDARLSVETPGFFEAVSAEAPHLRRGRVRGSSGVRILSWGAVLLAVTAGLYLGIPRLAGPIAALVPPQWEERLGTAVVEQLTQGAADCASPEAEAALAGLVERLAAARELPYRFEVRLVDRDEINAFAAPGGRLAVFGGLVAFAESPEELGGVLAHEVAHIARRHPTEGLIRSLGLSLTLGAVLGDLAGVGAGLGQLGLTLTEMSYSRAAEADADRVAVQLLSESGIDSRGLIAFFSRLYAEAEDLPAPLGLLSTHPLHAARVEAVTESAAPGEPPFSPEEWAAVKAGCKGE